MPTTPKLRTITKARETKKVSGPRRPLTPAHAKTKSHDADNRVRLKNIHPSEILQKDFLDEMHITAYRLAKDTGIPASRLTEILHERRSITADTAIRLSRYFGTSPELWLGLQAAFDLEEAKRKKTSDYARIPSAV